MGRTREAERKREVKVGDCSMINILFSLLGLRTIRFTKLTHTSEDHGLPMAIIAQTFPVLNIG